MGVWTPVHRLHICLIAGGFSGGHGLNFQWLSLSSDGDQDDAQVCVRATSRPLQNAVHASVAASMAAPRGKEAPGLRRVDRHCRAPISNCLEV